MFTYKDMEAGMDKSFIVEGNKKVHNYRNKFYEHIYDNEIDNITCCENCLYNKPYLAVSFCTMGGFVTIGFYKCDKFYIN